MGSAQHYHWCNCAISKYIFLFPTHIMDRTYRHKFKITQHNSCIPFYRSHTDRWTHRNPIDWPNFLRTAKNWNICHREKNPICQSILNIWPNRIRLFSHAKKIPTLFQLNEYNVFRPIVVVRQESVGIGRPAKWPMYLHILEFGIGCFVKWYPHPAIAHLTLQAIICWNTCSTTRQPSMGQ